MYTRIWGSEESFDTYIYLHKIENPNEKIIKLKEVDVEKLAAELKKELEKANGQKKAKLEFA